jgi:hypothetical protein
MKKSLLVKLALVLVTASTLSGCFWRAEDDGYRRGDYNDRDRGDHQGEHRDDRGGYR